MEFDLLIHAMRSCLPLLALLLGTVLTACEPCAGVARCSSGEYLSATGQVVDQASGRGVDGVEIDFIRVGGIAIAQDSTRVVTHDGGFWRVELSPSGVGMVSMDINVATPGRPPFRIRGRSLWTHEHGGDANFNERWVSRPYFNHFAEFFLRGSQDDRAGNATVEFRRTGGGEVSGPGIATGVYSRVTDAAGRYRLFPYSEPDSVLPLSGDAVVGDITLLLGGALGTSVLHGVSIPPTYVYREPSPIDRFPVGPSLGYKGIVRDSVSRDSLSGVQVRFERTGGIETTPSTFTTQTNLEGRFDFPPLRVTASGALVGRLIFVAAPAAQPETVQVTLPTFDADTSVLAPFYVRGPSKPSAPSRFIP